MDDELKVDCLGYEPDFRDPKLGSGSVSGGRRAFGPIEFGSCFKKDEL